MNVVDDSRPYGEEDEKAGEDKPSGYLVRRTTPIHPLSTTNGVTDYSRNKDANGTYYYHNGVLVGDKKRIISRDHPKLYFAYGSNLDVIQMQERCPHAMPVTEGNLFNYQLYFSGVANVRKVDDVDCPGAFWSVDEDDILALDRYEGYPSLYDKVYGNVTIKGESKPFFFYKMDDPKEHTPGCSYLATLLRGYCDWKMDAHKLIDAYDRAALAEWAAYRSPAACVGKGYAFSPRSETFDESPKDYYCGKTYTRTNDEWPVNEDDDDTPLEGEVVDEQEPLVELEDGEPAVTLDSANEPKIEGMFITVDDCTFASTCPLVDTNKCISCLMLEEDYTMQGYQSEVRPNKTERLVVEIE